MAGMTNNLKVILIYDLAHDLRFYSEGPEK